MDACLSTINSHFNEHVERVRTHGVCSRCKSVGSDLLDVAEIGSKAT
ncbi:hypothetical protein GF319_00905 [Candidatus Bathyarchaeota archaeon]|nr:hypothetical protein [Candidatus Bathyarchaeota archaeon]